MSQIKVGDLVKFITTWGAPEYVTAEYGAVVDILNDDGEYVAYVKFNREENLWVSPLDNLIKKEEDVKDNVNSPAHYNHNHKGIECIDAMEAMLTPEEFIGYLRGNIFKYLWRFPYKNGLEDIKKSQWYLNKLIEKMENN